MYHYIKKKKGSTKPQTNINTNTRTHTTHHSIVLCIELYAPTSSTQKFKLMRRGGVIHLYSNTHPHMEAPSGLGRGIGASNNYFI